MLVNSAFVEPSPVLGPKQVGAKICPVLVAELADARHSPDVLGVVAGRAVKAPSDSDAWLRAVMGGLGARGFDVRFDKASPDPRTVVIKVRLQTAWVTAISTNMTANVVLHVVASGSKDASVERDYRGSLSIMNWASGDEELQGLVDRAFSKALNDMAVDIHGLCS